MVALMYNAAASAAAIQPARRMVRSGFFTSPAIIAGASMPEVAYAIAAQKLTVPQFQAGVMSSGVATPRRVPTSQATATSSSTVAAVASAPTFSAHLPICDPIRFDPSATQTSPSVAASRKRRSSPRCACAGSSSEKPTRAYNIAAVGNRKAIPIQ